MTDVAKLGIKFKNNVSARSAKRARKTVSDEAVAEMMSIIDVVFAGSKHFTPQEPLQDRVMEEPLILAAFALIENHVSAGSEAMVAFNQWMLSARLECPALLQAIDRLTISG